MYGWGAASNPACSNWLYAITNPSGCFVSGAVDAAKADYNYWFGPSTKVNLAPPKAPTGDQLTLPPASGADADALVQDIADQQMRDQQAINAESMRNGGHWYWDVEAAAANTGDAVADAASAAADAAKKAASFTFNWLPWALGGLGVFALVALSAGGPRRYGR